MMLLPKSTIKWRSDRLRDAIWYMNNAKNSMGALETSLNNLKKVLSENVTIDDAPAFGNIVDNCQSIRKTAYDSISYPIVYYLYNGKKESDDVL